MPVIDGMVVGLIIFGQRCLDRQVIPELISHSQVRTFLCSRYEGSFTGNISVILTERVMQSSEGTVRDQTSVGVIY